MTTSRPSTRRHGGQSAPTTVTVPVIDNVTAEGSADSGTLTQTGPLTFDFVG